MLLFVALAGKMFPESDEPVTDMIAHAMREAKTRPGLFELLAQCERDMAVLAHLIDEQTDEHKPEIARIRVENGTKTTGVNSTLEELVEDIERPITARKLHMKAKACTEWEAVYLEGGGFLAIESRLKSEYPDLLREFMNRGREIFPEHDEDEAGLRMILLTMRTTLTSPTLDGLPESVEQIRSDLESLDEV